MDVSDWTAIISTVVAVAGLAVAVYQTWAARRTREAADEGAAALRATLSSVLTQVRAAADTADEIVQRAKEQAPWDEVVSLGRVNRAQLLSLGNDLARLLSRRDQHTAGALVRSAPPSSRPSGTT